MVSISINTAVLTTSFIMILQQLPVCKRSYEGYWSPPNLNQNSARFGSHGFYGSADIIFFICHVTMLPKSHDLMYVILEL